MCPFHPWCPICSSRDLRDIILLVGASYALRQDAGQECLQVRAIGGDKRSEVKLTVHWSSRNKWRVMALGDTWAECTLIHGDPHKFPSLLSIIDGYGEQRVTFRKVLWQHRLRLLPTNFKNIRPLTFQYQRKYWALISPRVKLCKPLIGEFFLWVGIIKPELRGSSNRESVSPLLPWRVVTVKPYKWLGDISR